MSRVIRISPVQLDAAGFEALQLAANLEQVMRLLGAVEFGGFPSDVAARTSEVRDLARARTQVSIDAARHQAPLLRGRASRARAADAGGMPWDAFGWIETFRSQTLSDIEKLERETGLSAGTLSVHDRMGRIALGRRLPHLTREQRAMRYLLVRNVGPYATKLGVRGYPRVSEAIARGAAHLPPSVLRSAGRLSKFFGPVGVGIQYAAAKEDGRSTTNAAAQAAVGGAVGSGSAWAIGAACAGITSETGIGPVFCFLGAAVGGGLLGNAAAAGVDDAMRDKGKKKARPVSPVRRPPGSTTCDIGDDSGPELRPAPVRAR